MIDSKPKVVHYEIWNLDASIFEDVAESIMITDVKGNIVRVNKAFTKVTGYTMAEVEGKNPRILQSGRQDKGFYRDFWKSIMQTGRWQGELWNRRKSGEVYPEWLSVCAARNEAGKVTHYVGIFTDITFIKRAESNLLYLATHDGLTNLANRTLFNERLSHAILHANRVGRMLGILFVDLDHFKGINDSMGHECGDILLKLAASRLSGSVREGDTVARWGGDEFTILLEYVANIEAISVVAQKIIAEMSQPFLINSKQFTVTASIGIAIYPDNGGDTETLVKYADTAMYLAKQGGGNQFRFSDATAVASRETLAL